MVAYMHVWVRLSYTGGFIADGALYVSHGFQDVERDKSDLVEPITTFPPALGGFDHLSDGGAAVKSAYFWVCISTAVFLHRLSYKNATSTVFI